MDVLSSFLQCGAFVLIPLITFGLGIWKIIQIREKYHRIGVAALIGFVFFEGSVIGLIIDPRSSSKSIMELILTSGMVGIVAFLFVLICLPTALSIFRIFTRN